MLLLNITIPKPAELNIKTIIVLIILLLILLFLMLLIRRLIFQLKTQLGLKFVVYLTIFALSYFVIGFPPYNFIGFKVFMLYGNFSPNLPICT